MNSSIKILHIISKTSYAGITTYVVRMIKQLAENNHVIVSCYKGSAYTEILGEGIVCYNLINRGNISHRYLLLKYLRIIKFLVSNSFNIIHYHEAGIGVLFLAFLFKKKAKIIHHLHGGNLVGDNFKQRISIFHAFLLKLLSNQSYQIAVAEHILEEYKRKISRDSNILLIKNSVPFSPCKKDNVKHSLGYIGRLDKAKGIEIFNFIVPELIAEHPNVTVYAKGDKSVPINNSIKFIVPSFQIEQFYENIDLLLFPSIAPEGLPLVVLEAITFDVGVIAHPLKGVVEILGIDYPLYFNDIDELLLKVRTYYSDTFDRNYLNCLHKKRMELFNFDEMINNIKLFYDSL